MIGVTGGCDVGHPVIQPWGRRLNHTGNAAGDVIGGDGCYRASGSIASLRKMRATPSETAEDRSGERGLRFVSRGDL